MPTVSLTYKGLIDSGDYARIPKVFYIGKDYNAINLGSYEKAYKRTFVSVWGSNPNSNKVFMFLLYMNALTNDATNPKINLLSLGAENDGYAFYYVDTGDSYNLYFYCSNTYQAGYPVYVFNSSEISIEGSKNEKIVIDESFKKISSNN